MGQPREGVEEGVQLATGTANVNCVSEMASKDAFGGETAVLLDIDYLKIPDTPNTKGVCVCVCVCVCACACACACA